MNLDFLDFEQPIAELQAKIEELRLVGDDAEINIQDEISRLEQKSQSLTAAVFSSLTPWQISQLARHPLRPHMLDYVAHIFDNLRHQLLGFTQHKMVDVRERFVTCREERSTGDDDERLLE